MEEEDVPHNRELYALLHISPDASDGEIGKAYRQWALIYHPDKIKDPHMKEAAEENFVRVSEAYQILSDKNKRKIYDIYGLEGLSWGSGTELDKTQDVKEELEKLRKMKEQQKAAEDYQPSGFIHSTVHMGGMAIQSYLWHQISNRNTVLIGGHVRVNKNSGDGAAALLFQHLLSPVTSIELYGLAGFRSLLIGLQTSHQLSQHVTRTMGLTLGTIPALNVGWQKEEQKSSASGHLSLGTTFLEASGNYSRRFSKNSHGILQGKIGSEAFEIEVGGGRRLSEYIKFGMTCGIGIQGIFWRLILYHRGQRFILPLLLWDEFDPVAATVALLIPTVMYSLAKKFIFKKEKKNIGKPSAKVQEARAAADKAKKLLKRVAYRKENRQFEIGGLIITYALYGSAADLKKDEPVVPNDASALQFIDVTLPLNFLVSDDGQLKLQEGVKKSGIMGFCDPCPGEPKQLYVEYTYGSDHIYHQVLVDDNAELLIPQERHRC